MAEINSETLKKFVTKTGSIGIAFLEGDTRMLHPELPDYIGIAVKAEHLWFGGSWRSREDFEKLMDQVSS